MSMLTCTIFAKHKTHCSHILAQDAGPVYEHVNSFAGLIMGKKIEYIEILTW